MSLYSARSGSSLCDRTMQEQFIIQNDNNDEDKEDDDISDTDDINDNDDN